MHQGAQPISVDPTFNHGAFEVTPLTYRHQLIEVKSKNVPRHYVPATMIGPTVIQHDKSEEMYDQALREIARRTQLKESAIGIITDGEEALIKACKGNFNKSIMLRCTNHFRSNCKDFLKSKGIKGENAEQILDVAFGEDGLIEAEDEKDLKQRRRNDVLTALERNALDEGDEYSSKFYSYLKDSEKSVLRTLIRSTRCNAGMKIDVNGVPERVYTNQSECVNSILASRNAALGYSKKNDLSKTNFI